ncbi:MAG: hypothetical protein R3E96_01725 [Planctomycetota bacterium]
MAVVERGGEAILNEGTYSVEDFHYSGTRPAGYHPLGGDTVNLTRRTEVALSIPGSSTWFRTVEDPSEGGGVVSGSGAYLSSSMAIWGQKAARLDRDAEEELVTLERVSGNQLKVWRTDFHSGTASTTLLATLNHSAWQIEACNLSVGTSITTVWMRSPSWAAGVVEFDHGPCLDARRSRAGQRFAARRSVLRWSFQQQRWAADLAGWTVLALWPLRCHGSGASHVGLGTRGLQRTELEQQLHRVEFSGGTSMASTIEGSSYAPYGIPVAGDFDGDGLSDVAQCSLGLVRIYHRSSGGAWSYFGQAGTNTATLMPHAAVSYAIDRNTDGVALLYNSSNPELGGARGLVRPESPI